MPDRLSTDYIGSVNYKDLEDKLKSLNDTLDDLGTKVDRSRKLRYTEIDIEAERAAGRFQPDELYVPQHIIDTNIRREQSAYVQYVSQSPRAVICRDKLDPAIDMALLDADLTSKLRFDGWQPSLFSTIDGFEAHGYAIMEVVMNQTNSGEVGHEMVQFCDFAFISDTRDIQSVEMTARTYYFTKTKLLGLCGDGTQPEHWNRTEVDSLLGSDPSTNIPSDSTSIKDRSLYPVQKNMFRVNGIVQVAWSNTGKCKDWLRMPRPLYLGRRKIIPQNKMQMVMSQIKSTITQQPAIPPSQEVYETNYPYVLFPYLISENDTITQLKGRTFLDQDLQEAVSSLVSSTVTQARRASGLYFSKDVSDPNDDLLLQKNVFFKQGCLINAKVTQFQLTPPDPGMFSAIQMLVSSNQNETSQVNWAVNNRKDSRKTATEITTSSQQQQQLSTVQVVLFSLALTQMYRLMVDIIVSRVVCGLIEVNQKVRPLYDRAFTVKPSGDTDVIERQQLIQQMMMSWQVIQNTPAAQVFLADLLMLMFPDRAQNYVKVMQDTQAQQQQQQASQQAQLNNLGVKMGAGIVKLADHPEYFSDIGRVHAFPVIQNEADNLKNIHKQLTQQLPQRNGNANK